MDEIPLSQPGEVILESMSITQKKASYPEVAILNHSLKNWGKGDVCQEYITPDCLKHAGVPETSTSMVSSLQGREISHSIPHEGSEASLVA